MFQSLIRFSRSANKDLLLKILASLVILCLLGPVVIRMQGEMPLTLQTLIIVLVSILFGWRVATPAVVLYILLGVAGLPVFSGYTSGSAHLFGSFGGFFFGFAVSATITGYLAEQANANKPFHHMALWFIGHALILLLGEFWLYKINPGSWNEMLKAALPGAGIKSAFGFLLTQSLARLLKGRENYYHAQEGENGKPIA